jgi:PPOX class probable F420-dependent enzyme
VVSPEAERFLSEHTRTFLLTLRPDGAPTCHPMVAFYRDGALYMTTYRKSAKVRNLTRDARVACVVTAPDDAPVVRAVVLRGRAEIVPADAMLGAAASGPRVAGAGRDVASKVQARLAEGKRIVVRIVPDEVRYIGDHG